MNQKKVAAIAIVAVAASLVLLLSAFSYADNGMTTMKDRANSQNNGTSSSSFPTVERTDVKVNPWAGHQVKSGESAGPGTVSEPPGSLIFNESYPGLETTQATVILNNNNSNQSFYMTTLDGNLKSVAFNEPDGTAVKFAGVTFTFARPPNIPLPSNPMMPVVVQFQDGTSETLFVQVQRDHPMTVLTSHGGPRAGITITQGNPLMAGLTDSQGKVKLLVSTS